MSKAARRYRFVFLLLLLGAGCGLPSSPSADPGDPDPPDPPPPPPPGVTALFLVENPGALNTSEQRIRSRLQGRGIRVEVIDDDAFTPARADGCQLVVMSKTVTSTKIANKLKGVGCGVVFWEDNQQKLDMLATIHNDGLDGTSWHQEGNDVHVWGEAPSELRAGLSGRVLLYTRHDQMTYAPNGDLSSAAIVIAEFEDPGGPKVIYVMERDAVLADGSRAAGRRAYFGLYQDTFQYLTEDGLRLFDALVTWATR